MDKQTESRKAFENWWTNEFCGEPPFEGWSRLRDEEGSGYTDEDINAQWLAWVASRESLVVELPQKISEFNRMSHNGVVTLEAVNYDEAIDDCAEAIRAIGIRIKGEGV